MARDAEVFPRLIARWQEMNTIDFEIFRQRLLAEKADESNRLACLQSFMHQGAAYEIWEDDGANDDRVGGAQVTLDDGRLQAIDDALERLLGGTYGRCDACGDRISDGYLASQPEATLCDECQNRVESLAPDRVFGMRVVYE